MEYVEPGLCVANCLGAPVCKYLRYHRKLNDYVNNFKGTRDELDSKMQDIELQLKAELLGPVGKIPKKGVENWLEKAKAMISEAQAVETKVSNGRYLSRACNGNLVDEKTTEMKTLLNNAPNISKSLVIEGPSVGLPLPTSEIVGEKAASDEIWTCLMQEDVSKIGVCGMGGVGKTTIIKHVHNDLLKEHRFERVIWITISKEFNVMKVQDDIASALKLTEDLAKEGDKLRRAAIVLEMMMKAGKHVLILDDVWDKVSLEEIGIPEPSSSNGCKLVLTTRSEQVCKYMGCEVIKVKTLTEEEALILFLNKVGPNMVHNQNLMPNLRLVVKECSGLPLTIVVVAGTLKGEDDPRIWKKALKELKDRIGKVEGAEAEVIERLKFSFDHLKVEKVKQCFLYCALYPEDFLMRKHELVECWIDEGFIEEMDTRQEMRDEGHVVLKRLEDNCLLENSRDLYYRPCVKMHDAVRDMALSITSTKPGYVIQAGLQLKEFPEEEKLMADVEKMSLMCNSISMISADVPPPKYQLLTTLLLQENRGLKKIPNSFFANMPCLGVLNLSGTGVECLPDSISELENLTALLLGDCSELRHVPCLAKLQGLKKLDLSLTGIEEVPNDIQELNIRQCHLSLGSLCDNISCLKNAIDLRDFSIIDCEGIECVVSSSSFSSSCTPPFQSLETLVLENLPELSGIMKDEGFGSTSILSPSTTFSHLKCISVIDCNSMKMLFPYWLLPNLQNLEEIKVYNCEQVVEILGAAPTSEQGTDIALIKFSLPKLRLLILDGLPELKSICSESGIMVCDSLQLIRVNECDKLKRIPPFVPLVGNEQPYEYAPPSLRIESRTEWWESLQWDDHPNFKNLLQPLWNR